MSLITCFTKMGSGPWLTLLSVLSMIRTLESMIGDPAQADPARTREEPMHSTNNSKIKAAIRDQAFSAMRASAVPSG